MTIDFTANADQLFNPLFFDLRKAKTRFVVSYGGAGSGKSYSSHQRELIEILETRRDTLVLRKFSADIRESCYKLFQNIASDWGITHLFEWRYSGDNRKITAKSTGASLVFKGTDDTEKLKSITGIRRVLIEEANQLAFEDFLEVNRRVRGLKDIQITLLLNPISENHWIKTKLIDSPHYNDRLTLLHTNHWDNKFLTEEDHQEVEALKNISENHYRIYALGEWGIEDKSKKFAFSYSKKKHVTKVEYNEMEFLYLSFDFNVNPITCTAFQHYDSVIYVPRAIKLANSDIYKLCDAIKTFFPDAMLIITGDATGKARSALAKDQRNYYTVIKAELRLSSGQIKVPSVNPKIEQNRVLVNAILETYNVQIDEENAEALIYDLTYVEVDEANKLMKDRSDEKKKADSLDTFRYYLNTFHRQYIKLGRTK